jgi:hypothetical protein
MATWLLLLSFLLPQAPAPRQADGGTIAGEIRLPDGTPAARVRVGALAIRVRSPNTNGITVLSRMTETDEAGRYRLENVPAGRYYIVAGTITSPMYYPGTFSLADAANITVVSGTNIAGLNFNFPRIEPQVSEGQLLISLGSISGRIVTENGRRWPLFIPTLYVFVEGGTKTKVGADGVKIKGSGTFGATPVSKDGTFSLNLADGEYAISLITGLGDPLTPADGYTVKSMSSGGIDLLKEKLKVDHSTRQTITITLVAAP